jgi:hypothetical protein
MNTGTMCLYHVRVNSYSIVGVIEQKDVVNSGVGGAKGKGVRTEVGCRSTVPITYPTMFKFKYLAPVIYSAGATGDVAASGSSLVLPRVAADTRGQHSTLHYAGASIVHYAMRGQQRGAQERMREGGTRERRTGRKKSLGLLVARQQELGR